MTGVGDQEHIISTTTAGGLHLPVYQDPQESKKKRNRLAQRKHREPPKESSHALIKAQVSVGLRVNTSTNNRQHKALGGTSARCRKSSSVKKSLTQHQSEESIHQIPHTTYQGSEMISALDFPLAGAPQGPDDSYQLPDSEQHMMPVSEASFDNVDIAYFADNLSIRQDPLTQAFTGFLSQNDPSLVYKMHQQQPAQYQPQVDRPSRTRAESEVSRTLLQTNYSMSPTQTPHTRATAEISRPTLQTHNVSPPAISTVEITRNSTDSFITPDFRSILPGEDQDQINSDSNSNTPSEGDIDSDSAQSGLPGTPGFNLEAGDLEARFERIIKTVEEAGFESIDDMSAQYYTATFKEDTVSHSAQSRSRSRSLHAFLATLHASTSSWSDREVQGYRQQITEAAESFYVGELSSAMEDIMQIGYRRSQALGEKALSPIPPTALSAQDLWQMVGEIELSHDFKQKKTMLCEKVSLFRDTSNISLNHLQTRLDQETYI